MKPSAEAGEMVEHRGKEKGPDDVRPRKRWRNPETCMCSRAPVSPERNLALLTQGESNPNSKCQELTSSSLFVAFPTLRPPAPPARLLFILIYLHIAGGRTGTATGEGASGLWGCRNGSSGLQNSERQCSPYTRSTVGFPSLLAVPYSKRIIFSPPGIEPMPSCVGSSKA